MLFQNEVKCNKYQRLSSLNLVSRQLKLCNIFIFGMCITHTHLFYQYGIGDNASGFFVDSNWFVIYDRYQG